MKLFFFILCCLLIGDDFREQRVQQLAHIVHAALIVVLVVRRQILQLLILIIRVISEKVTLRNIVITIIIVIHQRLEGRLESIVGLLACATVACCVALVTREDIIVVPSVATLDYFLLKVFLLASSAGLDDQEWVGRAAINVGRINDLLRLRCSFLVDRLELFEEVFQIVQIQLKLLLIVIDSLHDKATLVMCEASLVTVASHLKIIHVDIM